MEKRKNRRTPHSNHLLASITASQTAKLMSFQRQFTFRSTAKYSDHRFVALCYGPIIPGHAIRQSAVAVGFRYGLACEPERRYLCGLSVSSRFTPSELVEQAAHDAGILSCAGKVRWWGSHPAALEFFHDLGVRRMRPVWNEFSNEALAASAALLQNEIEQRRWIIPSKGEQVRPEVTAALEGLARFESGQPIGADVMSLIILGQALRNMRPIIPRGWYRDNQMRMRFVTLEEAKRLYAAEQQAIVDEYEHRKQFAENAAFEQAKRFGENLQREWNFNEDLARRQREQQERQQALAPTPEPVAEPAAPTPEAQPEQDFTSEEFAEIVAGKRPMPEPTEE